MESTDLNVIKSPVLTALVKWKYGFSSFLVDSCIKSIIGGMSPKSKLTNINHLLHVK